MLEFFFFCCQPVLDFNHKSTVESVNMVILSPLAGIINRLELSHYVVGSDCDTLMPSFHRRHRFYSLFFNCISVCFHWEKLSVASFFHTCLLGVPKKHLALLDTNQGHRHIADAGSGHCHNVVSRYKQWPRMEETEQHSHPLLAIFKQQGMCCSHLFFLLLALCYNSSETGHAAVFWGGTNLPCVCWPATAYAKTWTAPLVMTDCTSSFRRKYIFTARIRPPCSDVGSSKKPWAASLPPEVEMSWV